MADEDTPAFLTLPFDWYILEKWQSSDPLEDGEQRRQRHIELGTAFAALGHEGRRPYAQKAFEWKCGEQDPATAPRSVTEVPRDLLNAFERKHCDSEAETNPVWIRIDYGPGTDDRFEQLIQGFGDPIEYYEIGVANNAQRYNMTDEDPRAVFAFFPALLETKDIEYLEDLEPFDSPAIQNSLFAADRTDAIAEEDRLAQAQKYVFVADDEAMRSGSILWRASDQYGMPLLSLRIQPSSVQTINDLRFRRSLQEFRDGAARG